jgi:hypothetical protein
MRLIRWENRTELFDSVGLKRILFDPITHPEAIENSPVDIGWVRAVAR